MSNRVTDEEFAKIVAKSPSIRQVLITLGRVPVGGNYSTVKNRIKRLNLDTSHMLGQGYGLGMKSGPKRSIESYLSNKYQITSHKLRLRLLQENIFEPKCYHCNLTEWQGKPIPLELEHIDGNPKNNLLSNLTILCPNCHAQTPTYRGKNIKSRT